MKALNQLRHDLDISFARPRERLRPSTGRTIHPRAVPMFDRVQRPVRRTFCVATVAGIWDSELFGEQRVGNRKAMVTTNMPLHVHRWGHVAGDALMATGKILVLRMGAGIDFGRTGQAGPMTLEDKSISWSVG